MDPDAPDPSAQITRLLPESSSRVVSPAFDCTRRGACRSELMRSHGPLRALPQETGSGATAVDGGVRVGGSPTAGYRVLTQEGGLTGYREGERAYRKFSTSMISERLYALWV
jgi:hypothetical protein